jgi:hypothetical protein
MFPDISTTHDTSTAESNMETEYNRVSNNAGSRKLWVTEVGAATATPNGSPENRFTGTEQGTIGYDLAGWLSQRTNITGFWGWDLTDAGNSGKRAFGVLDTTNTPKGSPKSSGAYCRLAGQVGGRAATQHLYGC